MKLTDISRINFSDYSIATDIGGNAGKTAKILGAVFGKAEVANKSYAGIGLSLLDSGITYESLMQLALDTKLGERGKQYRRRRITVEELGGLSAYFRGHRAVRTRP